MHSVFLHRFSHSILSTDFLESFSTLMPVAVVMVVAVTVVAVVVVTVTVTMTGLLPLLSVCLPVPSVSLRFPLFLSLCVCLGVCLRVFPCVSVCVSVCLSED